MSMGQAAGTAAAMRTESGLPIPEISVTDLRERLSAQGALV